MSTAVKSEPDEELKKKPGKGWHRNKLEKTRKSALTRTKESPKSSKTEDMKRPMILRLNSENSAANQVNKVKKLKTQIQREV